MKIHDFYLDEKDGWERNLMVYKADKFAFYTKEFFKIRNRLGSFDMEITKVTLLGIMFKLVRIFKF